MPADLDPAARKKWRELAETCDPEVDGELLANYCRQYSSLLEIREERGRQQKAATFKTMVPGRDGTEVLNPLLVHEGRLVASLNRMLTTLGLMPSRDERKQRKLPDAGEIDPFELALCGPLLPEPSAAEIEQERRRAVNEPLLAQGDWLRYEAEHDKGRPIREDAR